MVVGHSVSQEGQKTKMREARSPHGHSRMFGGRSSVDVFRNPLDQHPFWNSAYNLLDDFPSFKNEKSRNASNAKLGRHLLVGINIQLPDFQLSVVFFRDLFDDRRNHFAGTTPFRPEVDENRFV